MKIRAVAWDIDGTLVDSEPVHLLALQKVCEANGVDISDLPPEHFVGVNLYQVWRALAIRFDKRLTRTEWIAALNQHYLYLAHMIQPMPGAYELVQTLSKMGIPQVAVSNSNREIVNANLHVCDLGFHMDFSISFDDVLHGKPNPEPYLQAATRLGLPVNHVLAIEDSQTGLHSAKAAGLFALGFGDHALLSSNANAIVEKLELVLATVNFEVTHGIHH
jgi:HAD superfamily hydrolase (TIGR01509 family)